MSDDDENWLQNFVNNLAADKDDDLAAILATVTEPYVVDGLKTTIRTHFIATGADGQVRVKELADRLSRQASDYCIPRSRIVAARDHAFETGSLEKLEQIGKEARRLFVQLDTSGEAGELLLYFLLERLIDAPQIIAKMSLKTSTNVHVHGADGIHAKFLDNGNLALYWGEAKLHKSASSAISECLASVAKFVTQRGSGNTEQDVFLLRTRVDAGDENATRMLAKYFMSDESESLSVQLRSACLVGFDLRDYPGPVESLDDVELKLIHSMIDVWHDKVKEHVGKNSLHDFEIDLFCVPMPSIQEFREAVLEELGFSS